MEKNKNKNFMKIALNEAEKSADKGEVPVGAVTVHENKILAKSGNMMVRYSNPLMHAEMIVLHKSSEILVATAKPLGALFFLLGSFLALRLSLAWFLSKSLLSRE